VPNFCGQRQLERRAHLRASYPKLTLAQREVVEGERDDLTRTQTVGRDEQEHGVVTPSHRGGTIDGVEKSPDHVPRQRPGKPLTTVQTRRVDHVVEIHRGEGLCREEAQ
jgi:hypothetical protein